MKSHMVSQPLLPAGSPCKVDASVPNEIIKVEQFAVEKNCDCSPGFGSDCLGFVLV